MGWKDDLVTEFLEVDECLPAIGQGALGIECREDDKELLAELAKLNHEETALAVNAERKFLRDMDAAAKCRLLDLPLSTKAKLHLQV